MDLLKRLSLILTAWALAGAQQLPDDPVMKARAQRALTQAAEGDLPPVPRGITEPPPLPPPELHLKDSRLGRLGKAHGKAAAKANAKVARGGKASKHSKHPAQASKKTGRNKKKVKA